MRVSRLLLCSLLFAAAGCNSKYSAGDTAPDFSATALDGSTVSLADYRGKVILLDFWATWCGPCVAEVPDMVALYDEMHPKGLEMIGISLDDDRRSLEDFVRARGMTWKQVFDGQGWNSDVAELYGVNAIPFTLLLDSQGRIIAKDLSGDRLRSAVKKALGE